ncbi:hypothetical protein ABZ348_17265 [Streptomyces sp. NPDC005963]|uniref:hypothetical protein n=1 Tax=Streptomyces sp. NPDC005963 TaxID=3156721 RepID=UPI003400E915
MGIKDQFQDKAQELGQHAKQAAGRERDESPERGRDGRERRDQDPARQDPARQNPARQEPPNRRPNPAA